MSISNASRSFTCYYDRANFIHRSCVLSLWAKGRTFKMANLVSSRQTYSKLLICCLIVLVLSSGCLSPHYPRVQQLLAQLQQQGIEFKADSPSAVVGVSALFPPE